MTKKIINKTEIIKPGEPAEDECDLDNLVLIHTKTPNLGAAALIIRLGPFRRPF